MPGKAEYWYVLRLEGDQALKEAQSFAKAVKKEMEQIRTTANIVLKATIDTKGTQAQATTGAQNMQAVYEKGLKKAQADFGSSVNQAGARQFTAAYRTMWEEGTIKPSAEAIKSIRGTQVAIRDLGKTAARMGVSTDDLVDMSGMDRAITAVQAIQRRIWGLRGMGYQLESYGRSMTKTAIAMGGAAALASNQYLKFSDPLGRAARNLDLNAELTETLDRRLTELAGTVSMMSPREQAEGLYLWAAATGAVVDSEAELNSVLAQSDQVQRLARLGNVSYGTAVEATTDILSQYQMNMSETERVVSTLIKVAAVSKAEVGDLAQAFSFAGAKAEQANTSFEDTAAIFQLLSAFGLRGTRAGRGVGMLLENLIAPSQAARKEIDALFNEAFGRTDVLATAEGQFVGTAQAINILAQATEHLTEVEQAEFVAKLTSQNASRALVPLLELERQARLQGISAIEATSNILKGVVGDQERSFIQMMESITGYTVDQESAIDTANRYWTDYAEHVSGQAEFIKASFSAAVTDVGREFTTVLLPVMKEGAELARELANYVKEHPEAAQIALGAAAGVGILGLLATAVGRGVRLVADVKTITMAYSLNKTAKDQIAAATTMMAASQTQLEAAGIQASASSAMTPGGVLTPASYAGGGATSAAGAGGALAFLANPAILVAALAGLIVLLDTMKKGEEAKRRDAAATAASTETYKDYVDALENADNAKNQVSEATYRVIRGQVKENDIFSQAKAAEWAEDFSDAQVELAERLKASTGQFVGMRAEYDELIRVRTGAIFQDLIADADEFNAEIFKSTVLLREMFEGRGIDPGVAAIMADEVQKLYFWGQLLDNDVKWQTFTAEDEARVKNVGVAMAGTGGEIEKATAATASARATWDALVAALDRADAAMMRTRDSLVDVLAALKSVPGAVPAIMTIESMLAGIEGSMEAVRFQAIGIGIEEGAKLGLASLQDLAEGAQGAADEAFGMFQDLSGYMPDEAIMSSYKTYLEQMEVTYREASLMGERAGQLHILTWQNTWQDWVDGHKDAQDQMTKDQEDAVRERERFMEQATEGFRNLVAEALKPTEVSDLDMLDTELGNYADKWDEQARRMKAALSDPMNEWRASMIPADVLAQGETAVQAYGKRWLDSFYSGMNPEAIDWPAFVESFKAGLQREIAQGNLIDRAIQELDAAGITATSEDVVAALGLQSPMQKMFLGGLSTKDASASLSTTMGGVVSGLAIEEGAFDTAATSVKTAFDTSLTNKLTEMSLPGTLNAIWAKQMADTPDPIIAVGRMAGALFWEGFEDSVDGTSLIEHIAGIVMQDLLEAIGSA